MEKVNIKFYKGETYQRNLTITDYEYPITEMYMTIKETTTSKNIDMQLSLGNGIELVDEDENSKTYSILIESNKTMNLKQDFEYGYDITIKSGKIREPIVMGSFKVEGTYTGKEVK